MIMVVSLNPAIDKTILIDNFKPDNMYRASKCITTAGGKGVNVARVVSVLLDGVALTGIIAGESGEWIRKQITQKGIINNFFTTMGETRTNINIIDPMNKTETEILEEGPELTQINFEEFLLFFERLLSDVTWIIFSGGIPKGASVDIYRTLIEKTKKRNIRTVLDSSGEALLYGIKGKPSIIKPNLRELSYLVKKEIVSPKEVLEASQLLLQQGIEMIVTSMGKMGVILVTKDLSIHAKIPKVKFVNSIGSGDSLVAGMTTGMFQGCSLEDSLKLGVACAVSNALFMEIGRIDIKEVNSLKSQIELRKL